MDWSDGMMECLIERNAPTRSRKSDHEINSHADYVLNRPEHDWKYPPRTRYFYREAADMIRVGSDHVRQKLDAMVVKEEVECFEKKTGVGWWPHVKTQPMEK